MKLISIITIIGATWLPMKANAAEPHAHTGMGLIKTCGEYLRPSVPTSAMNTGLCLGFVTGSIRMLQTWQLFSKIETICIPQNVTVGTLTEVFARYLAQHPQERHLNGETLIMAAMADAYPCESPNALKTK